MHKHTISPTAHKKRNRLINIFIAKRKFGDEHFFLLTVNLKITAREIGRGIKLAQIFRVFQIAGDEIGIGDFIAGRQAGRVFGHFFRLYFFARDCLVNFFLNIADVLFGFIQDFVFCFFLHKSSN